MIDLKKSESRERQLNEALEALHFGFRALTANPDARLATLGYSRIHHRILFFIGRNPACSIKDLLGIMKVSKQYLHRPLRQLIEDAYVRSDQDANDRRIKRLILTKEGAKLEEVLTGEQRQQFDEVFRQAGPKAESGWKAVMALLTASRASQGD